MSRLAPACPPPCPLCQVGMVWVDTDANDQHRFSCSECGGAVEMESNRAALGMRLSLGLRLAAAARTQGTLAQSVLQSGQPAFEDEKARLSTAHWSGL